METKTINVIYPKDGWILQRMAEAIINKLPNAYGVDYRSPEVERIANLPNRINYYINYNLFQKKSRNPDLALITHLEDGDVKLCNHFWWALENLDFAIFMSLKYANMCSLPDSKKTVIHPGINREIISDKIVLGVIGREYTQTLRKNPELMRKVSQLDFVDLKFTGGQLTSSQLAHFYRLIDYVFTPSLIEGGPMSLIEGLAAGKKSIFPKEVGFWEEFKDSVISYDPQSFEGLESILRELHQQKMILVDRVRHCTWDNFAREHQEIFSTF